MSGAGRSGETVWGTISLAFTDSQDFSTGRTSWDYPDSVPASFNNCQVLHKCKQKNREVNGGERWWEEETKKERGQSFRIIEWRKKSKDLYVFVWKLLSCCGCFWNFYQKQEGIFFFVPDWQGAWSKKIRWPLSLAGANFSCCSCLLPTAEASRARRYRDGWIVPILWEKIKRAWLV